jgi:hypothetical protein
VETFRWKVYDDSGNVLTGDGVLAAVFGPMANTGTMHPDTYGTNRPFWYAGNASQGAGYLYFSEFDAFLIESFTVDSVTVAQDATGNPAWSYYVAGGSGLYATPGYTPGTYPVGEWTFSNDGFATRTAGQGTFDGWVFGAAYPDPSATIDGAENTPVAANFAGASLAKSGPGALTLTGLQSYPTLTATGGVTNLSGPLGTGNSTINDFATLNVGASQTLAALNIGAGAIVTFEAGGQTLAAPEPGAAALLGIGAVILAFRRRRIV